MSHTIHQISVRGFDKNFSYIVADVVTRQAYIVDPAGDFLLIAAQIEAHGYDIIGLLLTHTHFDHFDQLETAIDQYDVPIYVHEKGIIELAKYDDVRTLSDHMELPLGAGHFKVIYTPGHTDDSVCFYISADQTDDELPKVLTGDTLFVGGCGRTSELRVKDLYESLAELSALPDDTVVFPGHDYGDAPISTIGYEKTHNKYYRAKNFNDFKKIRLG